MDNLTLRYHKHYTQLIEDLGLPNNSKAMEHKRLLVSRWIELENKILAEARTREKGTLPVHFIRGHEAKLEALLQLAEELEDKETTITE